MARRQEGRGRKEGRKEGRKKEGVGCDVTDFGSPPPGLSYVIIVSAAE
jgi:hypothetical protein